jgi:hypothetical protein
MRSHDDLKSQTDDILDCLLVHAIIGNIVFSEFEVVV